MVVVVRGGDGVTFVVVRVFNGVGVAVVVMMRGGCGGGDGDEV